MVENWKESCIRFIQESKEDLLKKEMYFSTLSPTPGWKESQEVLDSCLRIIREAQYKDRDKVLVPCLRIVQEARDKRMAMIARNDEELSMIVA